MTIVQVLVLSVIQGACELLPVSSSAHVLLVAKLMGVDPSSPQMTFLLVMLHTGTMFAVIVYFWERWRNDYFSSSSAIWKTARELIIASSATAADVGIAMGTGTDVAMESAGVTLVKGDLRSIEKAIRRMQPSNLLLVWQRSHTFLDGFFKSRDLLFVQEASRQVLN